MKRALADGIQGCLWDWYEDGLVDRETAHRLWEDVERRVNPPKIPDVTPVASVVATATVVATPSPVTRRAPAQDDLVEVAAELDVELEDAGGFWSRLNPAQLAAIRPEIVVWFVGVLLVLTGSLYFTRTNWSAWSDTTRSIVVAGGLVAYQLMFLGFAKLIERRSDVRSPRRILGGVALALAPVIGFALPSVFTHAGALFAGALGLATTFVSAVGARHVSATHRRALAIGGVTTLIAVAASRLWPEGATIAPIATSVAAWALLTLLRLRTPAVTPERTPATTPISARAVDLVLVYFGAAIALSTVDAVAAVRPWHTVAPAFAFLALAIAWVRNTVTEGTAGPRPRLNVVSALFLSAIGVAIAATGPLEEIPTRVVMLATVAPATAALIRVGTIYNRRLPIFVGLTTGLMTYFFMPAPFKAALAIVLDSAKQALGYGTAPLPVAYYGAVFIPYLALVWLFLRRRLSAHRTTIDAWLILFAIGLSALALTAVHDLRPAIATLPIYGIAFAVGARASGRAWLTYAAYACLGVAAHRIGGTPALCLSLWVAPAVVSRISGRGIGRSARMFVQAGALVAIILTIARPDDAHDWLRALVVTAAALAVVARGVFDARRDLCGRGYLMLLTVFLTAASFGAMVNIAIAVTVALFVTHEILSRVAVDHASNAAGEPAALAGCLAVVVLILPGAAPDAWMWLILLVVLRRAPLSTGHPRWAIASVVSLGLAAALAPGLPGTLPVRLFTASIITSACAHLFDSRDDRYGALALSAAAACAMFSDVADLRLCFHVGAVAIYLAFRVSRFQPAFGLAMAAALVAAVWDVVELIPSEHVPYTIVAALLLAGHAWVTQSALHRNSTVHHRAVPLVLAYIAGLLCCLAAIVTMAADDLALTQVPLLVAGVTLGLRMRRVAFDAFAWPVAVATLCALVLPEQWICAGVAAGALIVVITARPMARPFGYGTLAIAWFATGGEVAAPTVVVAALTAAATLVSFERRPSQRQFAAVAAAAATAVAYALCTLATTLQGDPELLRWGPAVGCAVLLTIELLAALPWFGEHARGWPTAVRWLTIGLAAASLMIDATGGTRLATHALMFVAALGSIRDARRTGSVPHAVAAEIALAVMWLELRTRSAWIAAVPNVDAFLMVGAAFVFTGVQVVARRGERGQPFAIAARYSALILPIAAPLTTSWDGYGAAQAALGASLAYAFIARVSQTRIAPVLSAVTLNLAITICWLQLELTSPQAYVLPVAATALVLAQLYRRDLGDKSLATIRMCALAAAYLSGFATILAFDTPGQALLMAGVCTAGVLLGVVLKIKSYLLMGAGFLVVDLATNIVRFGLGGQTQATIVLTGLGLVILGAMVAWSLNRALLTARVQQWATRIEGWAL